MCVSRHLMYNNFVNCVVVQLCSLSYVMTHSQSSCCRINNIGMRGLSFLPYLFLSIDLLEFLWRAWKLTNMYDNKGSYMNNITKSLRQCLILKFCSLTKKLKNIRRWRRFIWGRCVLSVRRARQGRMQFLRLFYPKTIPHVPFRPGL